MIEKLKIKAIYDDFLRSVFLTKEQIKILDMLINGDSIIKISIEIGMSERYGHNEETEKSFNYMVKSLEEFIKYLHEEAETPQQHQMLNETLQRSMR